MNKQLLLITALLLVNLHVFSQEEIELNSKDGLDVSYQLLLESEGKKKDAYILIVNAENNSGQDLYYPVTLNETPDGSLVLPFIPESKGFTKILVRNSTGLFGDGQSIIGDPTEMITTDKEMIFVVKNGETYTQETSFKVKTGVTPLITNTFFASFKELAAFDLLLTASQLNGDYISNCGNLNMQLNCQIDPEKGEIMVQTVNGQQFIWLRTAETTFIRETNPDYFLTYNKTSNKFQFSTADGITCEWKKQ